MFSAHGLKRLAGTFGAGVAYGVAGSVVLLGVSAGFRSFWLSGAKKLASMVRGGGRAPVASGQGVSGAAPALSNAAGTLSSVMTVGKGVGSIAAANDYYGATASSTPDDGSSSSVDESSSLA